MSLFTNPDADTIGFTNLGEIQVNGGKFDLYAFPEGKGKWAIGARFSNQESGYISAEATLKRGELSFCGAARDGYPPFEAFKKLKDILCT